MINLYDIKDLIFGFLLLFALILIPILSVNITLIATLITAIFLYWSIIIAKRAHTANVVDSITKDYATKEMLDAMRTLRKYKDKFGDENDLDEDKDKIVKIEQIRKKFYEDFLLKRKKDRKNELKENDQTEFDEINKSRRLVSHHFQRIYYLFKTGAIPEELAMELSNENQSQFYLEVIEPLEGGKNRNYNEKSFDQFRTFYPELAEKYHKVTYDSEKNKDNRD
jgi:hypothetical protein